jgi:DNA-binding NarL/FixJ family response regulator
MSIRIVITDDHPIVRDGLRFSIERSKADIVVVAEASDGRELLNLVGDVQADVYVMDVTMPIMNGIEATRELLRRDPSARVIILSLHHSDSLVCESLRAGARGFLTKETATRNVVEAIQAVHAGRCFLSPDVAQYAVSSILRAGRGPDQPNAASILTRRERSILQLVAEGKSGKEIASLLGVSIHTVHRHRTNLMAKLDLHDQVALVRYAVREGIAKL